jgi:hypothetical protein
MDIILGLDIMKILKVDPVEILDFFIRQPSIALLDVPYATSL